MSVLRIFALFPTHGTNAISFDPNTLRVNLQVSKSAPDSPDWVLSALCGCTDFRHLRRHPDRITSIGGPIPVRTWMDAAQFRKEKRILTTSA